MTTFGTMVLTSCTSRTRTHLLFCESVAHMKSRSIDHRPAVSLAAVAILIVISAAALKYLGS
jgi:hypothetical protein